MKGTLELNYGLLSVNVFTPSGQRTKYELTKEGLKGVFF